MESIIKEEMLYRLGGKFGMRTWRKIRMVLFKPSSSGVGRLELYNVLDNNAAVEQKKVGRQKTPERKVVRLCDCLSVTPALKESCPPGCTAFYIHTTQNKYTLASAASQDWLSALNLLAFQKDPEESDKGTFERGNSLTMEDNDLYSSWESDVSPNQYAVTVQSTEASRRCQLSGDYLVSPDREALTLLAVNTGLLIYSWPYIFLRKFGQVEGGFSIEAGRRCDSGEGVFIFLSKHRLQIYQTISERCSRGGTSSTPPVSAHRRSFSDQSPADLPLPSPPVYHSADFAACTKDELDDHYSTINDAPLLSLKRLSLVQPFRSNSSEPVMEHQDHMDECCHSLDLDHLMQDNVYDNIRRDTPPLIRKDVFKQEIDNSDCIYSELKMSPSNPPTPPISSRLSQLVSQPPSCKPRYQLQLSVKDHTQPGCYAQSQAVDDMKEEEEEEALSSQLAPTEAPGSFKHRLAEIISKDLAKFQLPHPPAATSPTFSP
ncbi:uncharacterized protein V6R79_010530 [Siganus canaliculatus]